VHKTLGMALTSGGRKPAIVAEKSITHWSLLIGQNPMIRWGRLPMRSITLVRVC
jgi:hypothetical protein